MESGVLGVLYQLAVSPVGEEPSLESDFATILHHPMEEQIALDKAQRKQLAMFSIVPLVKNVYLSCLTGLKFFLN